jgi:hypothetical protein
LEESEKSDRDDDDKIDADGDAEEDIRHLLQ